MYIPSNDADYSALLAQIATVLADRGFEVGVVQADLTPLDTARTAYATAVATNETAKTAAKAATAAKNTARADVTALIRPLVRRICAHPGMTDELRETLGLGLTPATPASQLDDQTPLVALEAIPGTVFVHFGTEPGNERINSKPAGVKGCNIYRKKSGETEFRMVAYATSSPYLDPIVGPAADYTYVVQYRGTKPSDLGHESMEATIAARGSLQIAA